MQYLFVYATDNCLDFKKPKTTSLTILDKLIKAGADINVANEEGWTLLHLAVKSQQEEVMLFLVEQGADPRMHSRDGTALELACMRRVVEQVWDEVETKVEVLSEDSLPRKLQSKIKTINQLITTITTINHHKQRNNQR